MIDINRQKPEAIPVFVVSAKALKNNNRRYSKMYNNGFDFFRSLKADFGTAQAIKIANDYLDMQIHNTNQDEYQFCVELYRAIKAEMEV